MEKTTKYKIYVTPDMKIKELKSIIKDKEEVPVDNQRFKFPRKQMHDYNTVADYKIKIESCLQFLKRHVMWYMLKMLSLYLWS